MFYISVYLIGLISTDNNKAIIVCQYSVKTKPQIKNIHIPRNVH